MRELVCRWGRQPQVRLAEVNKFRRERELVAGFASGFTRDEGVPMPGVFPGGVNFFLLATAAKTHSQLATPPWCEHVPRRWRLKL